MRIALYQGTTPIPRLIRWQTRSKYSHAAFLFDDGRVVEALWPKVVLAHSLGENHPAGTKIDIFKFRRPLNEFEKSHLENLALDDVGSPYDILGVLRFLTRSKDYDKDQSLFCSEQVYSRCELAGRPLLDRTEAWRVPPDWINRSRELLPDGPSRILV